MEEKWDDTVQNPPLSKLEKKTWLWLCCRLTLWPQSSTNPLLVLDLIKTKTTPKSINMKLISIYQERSISSRKPPRGTMLINQTNCLSNPIRNQSVCIYVRCKNSIRSWISISRQRQRIFPFPRDFSQRELLQKHMARLFSNSLLLILFTYYLSSDFSQYSHLSSRSSLYTH